jgi:hypothetical protein
LCGFASDFDVFMLQLDNMTGPFEVGPVRCRVCGTRAVSVLEIDPDPETYDHVRENMECYACGNMTLEFVDETEAEPEPWESRP